MFYQMKRKKRKVLPLETLPSLKLSNLLIVLIFFRKDLLLNSSLRRSNIISMGSPFRRLL